MKVYQLLDKDKDIYLRRVAGGEEGGGNYWCIGHRQATRTDCRLYLVYNKMCPGG